MPQLNFWRQLATTASHSPTVHSKVLIVGGGTAGIACAAELARSFPGGMLFRKDLISSF